MGQANAMGPKQFHYVLMVFPKTEYRADGRLFARLRKERGGVVSGMAAFDEREMVCRADPDTFQFPDHCRDYPILRRRLKRLDAKTLKGYPTRQWRHTAPKTWPKKLDAGERAPRVARKAAKLHQRKLR